MSIVRRHFSVSTGSGNDRISKARSGS